MLEGEQVQGAAEASRTATSGDQAAHLALVCYDMNAVAISVEAPPGGWVLLSDVYYPGWPATIDGAPTPVLRADYVFRSGWSHDQPRAQATKVPAPVLPPLPGQERELQGQL